jgi:hypothetical protein
MTVTDSGEQTSDRVMELLSQHVPLCLLLDVGLVDGPGSQEILRSEGQPEARWWEPRCGAANIPTPRAASSTGRAADS